MEMNLSPMVAKKIFEGEGGSYSSWSSTEFPQLGEANVGAGLLVLKSAGFALPHYADSKKLAFVLRGFGIAGLTLSNAKTNSKEEVTLGLMPGHVIPLPLGAVSWWYSSGYSELVIIFLGETSTAYVPGEFTYFLMTGALGVLGGFSTEFLSRAYNMNELEVNTLVKSQTASLLVKLRTKEGQMLPLPHQDNDEDKWVKNIVNTPPDIVVEKAGFATSFTGTNFPFLEEVGLSCTLLKLEANAMLSPMQTNGYTVQVFYVAEGSGKVQIVGMNGERFLDSNIVAGQLLIVPKFFFVAIIADGEGLVCFSIKTTLWPDVGDLASKQSVFNACEPAVLQVAFNVTPEFANSLKGRMAKNEILIPPNN